MRRALVTGGTRGIGAAVASALRALGVDVTVAGRTPIRAKAFVQADVTDPDAVARMFEAIGPVDILVNNAGGTRSASFATTDRALWRETMAVNLDGAFYCTQAALPGMLAARWGRIVTIASTAGLVGYRYVSAYCAAKHAVIGMTRALALEVATSGITVNAVCPGYTETDMMRDAVATIVARTGRTAEQAAAELVARNPQRRFVQPEEVANAVAWLCAPGSEAITGQAIPVAGGEVT